MWMFCVSPFELVLSPADLRLPLFRLKFLVSQFMPLCWTRTTSDTIYTGIGVKTRSVDTWSYNSTTSAMEGKTLLIDGAIPNHINPAPG